MADQQQLMEDFAAFPVNPASKSALLAALPLPSLVNLLGDESRVELVRRRSPHQTHLAPSLQGLTTLR